jgi:hypothetical protein
LAAKAGFFDYLLAVSRAPSVWVEAVRAGVATRRRHGLGVSSAYLRWRNYTAYGSHNDVATADDLVHYLEWRRQMRRLAKWEIVA